jgi:hypothetical protein
MAKTPYYNERVGGAAAARYSFEKVVRMITALYIGLEQKDYFQECFGYHCVDKGYVNGTAGADVGAFIERKTFLEGMAPLSGKLEKCDELQLFTLIEFLHDYVSKPVSGEHHSYNGCGWHYDKFDRKRGREEWREAVNEILPRYGEGFELDSEGRLQRMGEHGLREIMSAPLPAMVPATDREKVDDAVARYRRGKATRDERRIAVRDLADVLEFHKQIVQATLSKKDVSGLFEIANKYAIRHHDKTQNNDYDPAWLSWMFYLYLSTIHLVFRLEEAGSVKAE